VTNIVYLPGAEPPDDGDPEDRLPIKLPGRSPNRSPAVPDQPSTELVGPVLQGEIVDDDEGPVLVDPPAVPVSGPVWSREVQWSPVRPGWLADEDTRRAAVAYYRRKVAHTAQFHAVRSPVYAARYAGQVPVGAARALGGATRWVRGMDTAPLLDGAKGDPKAAVRAVELRREMAATRAGILSALLIVGAGLWWVTGQTGIWWDRWLLVLAALTVLGWAGRRRDRPILSPAVEIQRAPRLTSETVTRALGSLGIPGINAAVAGKGSGVTFPAPITRDGPGWRADVDLPHGVTVGDILEKRDRLASGLRRPLGCVWPEPDPAQHAGRLVLWVGDQPMNAAKAPPWPLAKAGQADLFKPVPFGHDQRGRLVTVPMVFESVLIGAKPRMGKTVAVRVLLLAAALDPTAELRVFELKGTGDLGPLEPVAHHYGSGADDETIGECMASLKEVYGLLETRAKTIKGLPRDVCPESKVTPELAQQRRLGLFPIVVTVDECQELFSHPDIGEEADRVCTAIIKRGPALGIILILATQRPDAKSLPTGVSANAGVRFCLRVMGDRENNMVLGAGMYAAGIRATQFTKNDKGIGYLIGADDDPQIVRTANIDGPEAERIVERARVLREAAGTLSGYALGEQEFDTGPDRTLLHDLLQVMGPDEDQVHSAELCARLADAWSARYEGWDATTLATALRAVGVQTKQVRAGEQGRNGRGVTRESLLDALGEPRAD
jgi:S-DNA-T family DNA segregation ATPase FtsK/SpoIIIE